MLIRVKLLQMVFHANTARYTHFQNRSPVRSTPDMTSKALWHGKAEVLAVMQVWRLPCVLTPHCFYAPSSYFARLQ